MNITGIITEYNPFHNGHLYHLNTAKKNTNCDGIVCIMSGNFVQRGEPTIIDKWKRTEMALVNGVDLVIELPTFYAVSSAEFFAKGAIKILNSTGVINNIFFGSECGDINLLYKIAKLLTNEPDDFKLKVKENLKLGITYAKAREKALVDILQDDLDHCLRIPMTDKVRALNLSNCVALVLFEVLRQQDYPNLSKVETIKSEDYLES